MQVASPDAFALAIGDSIPLQEVERQLLGSVRGSVQTRKCGRQLRLERARMVSYFLVCGFLADKGNFGLKVWSDSNEVVDSSRNFATGHKAEESRACICSVEKLL
jgi:hypothetical protein